MKIDGLLALRGQPPNVSAAAAEAVALELYGLTAGATPLEGERDRNFRLDTSDGRRLVLKFIDHEADDVVIAGQSAALAHLTEQNARLPIPRVIRTRSGGEVGAARISASGGLSSGGPRTAGLNAAGPGTGGPGTIGQPLDAGALCRVRLVTYLSGKPILDTRWPTHNRDLLRSVGNQVAHLDRALGGFFHPALAQPIAWDVRRAPLLLPVLPQVRSAPLRRLLATALGPIDNLLRNLRGLRSQAIHGDCHGRNLLVNKEGDACVGIIDLGDMIHAPLVLEAAVTMAEFLTDGIAPLEALPEFLAGYASAQPLERADINVLYDLMAARIAIGVLIQTWRDHNSVSPGASNLEESSARALDALASRGKDHLTKHWLDVSEGASAGAPETNNRDQLNARRDSTTSSARLLRRRHWALGANAELSYDRPLHLVRGVGVWVYTNNGERLLDVYNNVPHVGHAHPDVVAAIASQAKLIASNTRYLDERIIEYVERLTATLPPDLDTCLFVNSGSEANDVAWRIAKSHTGHNGALVMKYAYHGITDAITGLSPAICANVPVHVEQLAAPLGGAHSLATPLGGAHSLAAPLGGAHSVSGAMVAKLASAAAADVANAIARLATRGFAPASLMIDSALTSTGIFDPPADWIAPIVTAVRSAGGLVIGDEVQFGLGRSGSDFWGFSRRGYQPDIVTLGKPVGNGYPLGVVITRRSILEKFQRDTGFFSTFGGNPVAAAAGLAVLDVIQREQLVENARTTGGYFIQKLRELAAEHAAIRDVRGLGLMIGVEVTDRLLTKRLVNGLRDRSVLIGSEGPLGNVLKLRPPMPFRPEHVDMVLEALSATLLAVRP